MEKRKIGKEERYLEKYKTKNGLKNSNGITLIALVVTIIVLLILAGVSISTVFSENGIIKKAKEAQDKMNEAMQNDMESLNQLNELLDSYLNEDNSTGNNTGENTVLVTSITLDKTSANIVEGSTLQLTATISPENATNKDLEWTSSNTGVATVEQNGKVTTLAEGSVTITATAKDGSGVKAECSITAIMNPSNYTWTQSKTTVTGTHKTVSGKTVTYEVGEDYNYTVTGVTDGYTAGWGILGAGAEGTEEAGKLLIMTTSDVGDSYKLSGKDGYNNGISYLNTQCVQKCGTGARSINVDDINRVTGYNPEEPGDGIVMWEGGWSEYGNIVTYTATKTTSTKITTSYTSGLSNSVYYHPDGRQIGGSGGTQVSTITETSTAYMYYPYSLTTSNAVNGTCNGISTNSKAYEMIFGTYANTNNKKGNQYWLASSCVDTNTDLSRFSIRYVTYYGEVSFHINWFSNSTANYAESKAVRAVVPL